ncbi:MAG: ATP-binding protein, partial [Treponema sp.]|nr:ATP-binding protein [Treponema sp.]
MIVEFSIANTFSIKEPQTVSFEAVESCRDEPDVHCVQIGGKKLLKLACMYGANASGKTNILTALRFYVRFAIDSFTSLKPSEQTHFIPFRFDDEAAGDPGFFNLVFFMKNNDGAFQLYNYELLLCATHVVKEKLLCGRRLLYERFGDGDVKWGSGIGGAKKLIAAMTRPNCTVLSTAAQAQHPLFTAMYAWLSTRFGGLEPQNPAFAVSGSQLSPETLRRIEDDASYKQKVIGMFNASDIAPISDIRIETQTLSDDFIGKLSPAVQDELARNPDRAKSRRALFVHKYADREY